MGQTKLLEAQKELEGILHHHPNLRFHKLRNGGRMGLLTSLQLFISL